MRTKEEAFDYRYFPEPDLPPFIIDKKEIEKIKESLPEFPKERAKRFIREFRISEYKAKFLTSDSSLADYFEKCRALYNKPEAICNWIMGPISRHLSSTNLTIEVLPLKPENLVKMLKMIDKGTISGKMANEEILPEMMIDTKKTPEEIVTQKGLLQISDEGQLQKIAQEVIKENAKTVSDYREGKEKALIFLVGQVMKKTKGKANPKLINEILKKELNV